MSKTFRPTIAVLVLLAGGAPVTACRSSSDKDQSKETAHSKVERAHAPRAEGVASLAGEPTHGSSKATHAQAKAHPRAEPGSKESSRPGGNPALPDPLSSMTP